jgi:hypothetical protein
MNGNRTHLEQAPGTVEGPIPLLWNGEGARIGVVANPNFECRALDEGRHVRRIWKSVAVLVGVVAVLAVMAGPAFGAAGISSPSDPFTVPNSGDGTTPAKFAVNTTGWAPMTPAGPGDTVDLMICDSANPVGDPTWTAAAHCDIGTDVSKLANSSGNANFLATGLSAIQMFRGAGPNNQFACNASTDPPVSGIPNFTNCRLVAMNATGNNVPTAVASITLTLSPTSAQTPEVPYAVILPIGALVVGGGFLVIRRRRAQAAA